MTLAARDRAAAVRAPRAAARSAADLKHCGCRRCVFMPLRANK
jgi:hypothetical protein